MNNKFKVMCQLITMKILCLKMILSSWKKQTKYISANSEYFQLPSDIHNNLREVPLYNNEFSGSIITICCVIISGNNIIITMVVVLLIIIITNYRSVATADIDECSSEVLNYCDQMCINTAGAYHCTCVSGYFLDPTDNATCLGNFVVS